MERNLGVKEGKRLNSEEDGDLSWLTFLKVRDLPLNSETHGLGKFQGRLSKETEARKGQVSATTVCFH